MSRDFQSKNKDLVNLSVVSFDEIWEKKNGKYILRRDVDVFRRVSKGFSSSITTSNSHGENHRFVEDFSRLPKNCKNKITNMLLNENKKVAYLVKSDAAASKQPKR